MKPQLPVLFAVAALALVGCGGDDDSASDASTTTTSPSSASSSTTSRTTTFALTSSAFNDGEPIPKRFTCDGASVSPPLAWSGAPDGTVQLALIVDDPDAPSGNFVHWVMWGIAPSDSSLPAGKSPRGALQGKNGTGQAGYTGPCPPSGVHHYKFQLYALSAAPDVTADAGAQELRDAIAAITIGSTTLTGTYERA